MPVANIRGVNLNYEVLGTHGPWLALSPGGRRALDLVRPLAQRMADAGYRVLVHDRRNCGLSDIAIGGESSEYEIWADDLYALLTRLDALPAVLGGQYIRAARTGGMAAVCELDHFKERIAARPTNRDTLMAMDAGAIIAAMERWREQFRRGAEFPVIGASEQDLNSIRVPTCIIPGNDKTHNHAIAETAHRMISQSELFDLFPGDLDVDLVPPEDWAHREAEMAAVFTDFLSRRAQLKAA
jgi:hypothetical protein